MKRSFDIVIVGGGPAGSAAALAVRRHARSLSVAIVEASDFDRPRIGEDLPAPARKILSHLGVWDAFVEQAHRPSYGAASSWGGIMPRERHSLFAAGGHGWHLDRPRFDGMLFSAAASRGAHVVRGGCVRRVRAHGEGWSVELSDGSVRTGRLLVDATGRSAIVARRYGGRRLVTDRLVGFARYFDDAPHTDPSTVVEPFADGWWYSAGLPGGSRVAVCFTDADLGQDLGLVRPAGWEARLEETTIIGPMLRGAGGPVVVRPTESRRFERAAGSGWLAVGDAASVYDPLSSRGLAKALRTGVFAAYAAADRLLWGDDRGMQRYERFIASSFAGYEKARSHFYDEERRWADRPFWQRRHRLPRAVAVLLLCVAFGFPPAGFAQEARRADGSELTKGDAYALPLRAGRIDQRQDVGRNVSHSRKTTDTTRVLDLGEVVVVAQRTSAMHELAHTIPAEALRAVGRQDLSETLRLAPGVTLRRTGPRNESDVLVRGFDLRRVPMYVDGIPVYPPYDGLLDLSRFLTNDVGQVRVSSGLSSMLYGPNGLGGTINVVSRMPVSQVEALAEGGWRSGGGREGTLSLGTRQSGWFAVADAAYVERDAFPLSDSFEPAPTERGGRRENSAREDIKLSTRFGFTPGPDARYLIGYVDQRGTKGNPPYAGADPDVTTRYWRWPQWDKQSLYALADQSLHPDLHLRARAYYDRFAGELFSYDDETYSTQTRPSSFRQSDDDATLGGSLQLSSTALARHKAGVNVTFKRDAHVERRNGEDRGRYRDATWSVALEDETVLGAGVRAVGSVMYSARRTLEASTPAEEFDRADNGALDAQLVFFLTAHRLGEFHAGAARRTRFPTIKDRYSYRQGRAIPNPELAPEHAVNLQLGYAAQQGSHLRISTTVFMSLIDGVIQAVDIETGPGGRLLAQLQNAGRARHLGVEGALDVTPLRGVRAGATYGYLHLKNLSDPDLRFTHVPSHALHVYGEASPVRRATLRVIFEANSSRFSRVEGMNLVDLSGFTSLDVELTYRFRGATLRGGVTNLLDANYERVAGYPEPGRSAFVRIGYAVRR